MTTLHDELGAFLAAHAAEADAQRRLPSPVFDALEHNGLLAFRLPAELGGPGDVRLVELFDTIEALARIDGSAAWITAFMGTAAAYPAARLPDAGVADVLAGQDGHWPAFAGTFPPTGAATPADGGYRVRGRWGFASGIHHARWVVAGCVVPRPDAVNELLWCVLPIHDVTVEDTWFAIGLRGTGSCDYVVDDVFVPTHRTFRLATPPERGEALHRLPIHAFLTPDHTAVTLGSARRTVDALAEHVHGKVRVGSAVAVADRGAFRRDLGRMDARLRAARSFVREVLERIDHADDVSAELLLDARIAATHAAEVAVDVVTAAYRAGGAHTVVESGPLSRAFRDTMTSTQHVHVTDEVYEQRAELMLQQQEPPRHP
jgi:alkylation response protein AidB-like acyl-CoA dehydrogenase